jgi:peptidoglycan hydrolase-like protein with peptidoglycan-binding domain/cell division septum initiation protein DivIVA
VSVVSEQRVLHGAIASEDVRLLQNALDKAGLKPGPVDGIYGYRTAAAVRRFQEKQGLEQDGVVGREIWQRLAKEKFGGPLRSRTLRGILHGATSGEDVAQAQQALANAGFNPGDIDGVYGPQTARAVRRFQEERNLAADGVVGPTTWSALRPPGPGDVGTFPRSPSLLLVSSEADLQAVRPLEQAASTLGVSWRSYVVEGLGSEAIDDWLDLVVVLFLSPALVSWSTADHLIERATRGEIRVVPVLLTRVDLVDSPFADVEVLPADGTALGDHADPATAFRELITTFLSAPSGSILPGFAADAADGTALFGVGERVEFLASVLTSQSLETPLAIGLFGDWGSGKSFFMRRLQERIRLLADHSAQAGEEGEPSLYCSNIRQVTFNAWLYSDGDIWPSFAAQVFRSVTGAAKDVRPAAAQAGHLADYQQEVQSLAERRDEAESEEAELGRRLTQLDAEIQEKRSEIEARAGDLSPEAGATAKLIADLGEAVRRLGRLARDWRRIRPSDLLILTVPVAVAVAAIFFDWARILAAVTVIGAVVAFVVAGLRYVERTRLLREQIDGLERQRQDLQAELERRTRERETVQENLGAAAELPLLPQFAEEQASRWLGRQQLGVVTEIRLAFERLSELIEENRTAEAAGDEAETTLPIDRVIIYVDDLDRCSHDVVVRVLETIKVLLDLRHFVVVVGVDSRWLFRSIQVHFSELLKAEDEFDPDAAWVATPQNYLEKIFQYSIVLRPLEPTGFAELIDSILPVCGPDEDRSSPKPPEGPVVLEDDDKDAGDVETTDGDRQAGGAEMGPVSWSGGGRGPDLMPGSLVVTREEVEFMKRLGPLFETPRAAKRLANVYRLVRVSAGADRLADSAGYEPVLLLLSIGIAYPGLAGDVFQAVGLSSKSSFREFLKTLPPPTEPERSPGETAQWNKLLRALTTIGDTGLGTRDLETFTAWIPVVAEFSFHPWQELLPAETRS